MRGRNNNGGGGNNNNNNNNNNSNNNNRKGPNPLTRNYESNGPDVKIRGSAQQIAEKYAQLARDAQGSGDRVMAENYLQHAEHYNRIIAAAQAQMPIQNIQANRDASDDDMDDERDEFDPSGNGQGQPVNNVQNTSSNYNNGNASHSGNGGQDQPQGGNRQQQPINLGSAPQPVIDGMPAEVAFNADVPVRTDDEQRDGRQRGGAPRDGGRRDERQRNFQPRPDRDERPIEQGRVEDVQPAQIAAEAPQPEAASGADGEAMPPRRGRRPRRPRIDNNGEGAGSAEAQGGDAPQPHPGGDGGNGPALVSVDD